MSLSILLILSSCAAQDKENQPPLSGRDLSGMDSRYSPEAQKLYAKARLLWDRDEQCADPQLALEYLDITIDIEPEFSEAYMRRALAASELGYWDDAFDDSSKAIRLEPKSANYTYRGLIFMREGNYMGARKDLEKALKLDPKNAKAKAYLQKLRELEK